MLTDYILPISPPLMRFYGTQLPLDLRAILQYPTRKRPPPRCRLRRILGVDSDQCAIEPVNRCNRVGNLDLAPAKTR